MKSDKTIKNMLQHRQTGDSSNESVEADTTFAERMKQQFDEAEAFFLSGKLLKDNALLEKSRNLFQSMNDAFEQIKDQDAGHFGNSVEAVPSMDRSMQTLHARSVSWQSMTCSALNGERQFHWEKRRNNV